MRPSHPSLCRCEPALAEERQVQWARSACFDSRERVLSNPSDDGRSDRRSNHLCLSPDHLLARLPPSRLRRLPRPNTVCPPFASPARPQARLTRRPCLLQDTQSLKTTSPAPASDAFRATDFQPLSASLPLCSAETTRCHAPDLSSELCKRELTAAARSTATIFSSPLTSLKRQRINRQDQTPRSEPPDIQLTQQSESKAGSRERGSDVVQQGPLGEFGLDISRAEGLLIGRRALPHPEEEFVERLDGDELRMR